jgi:hypothetical protein
MPKRAAINAGHAGSSRWRLGSSGDHLLEHHRHRCTRHRQRHRACDPFGAPARSPASAGTGPESADPNRRATPRRSRSPPVRKNPCVKPGAYWWVHAPPRQPLGCLTVPIVAIRGGPPGCLKGVVNELDLHRGRPPYDPRGVGSAPTIGDIAASTGVHPQSASLPTAVQPVEWGSSSLTGKK